MKGPDSEKYFLIKFLQFESYTFYFKLYVEQAC